jgi:ADP-heptose:LPS heptosyltransferase
MKPATLKIDQPCRILVDRRKAVGDVLMVTPVLRELRKRYGKEAFIQVVTEETIVLENNPHIDRVIAPTEMSREDRWDQYINLNDAYESNISSHYVDAYLYRTFGHDIADIDRSIVLEATDEDIENIEEAKADIGDKYIVIHMRRWAWENKNVDPLIWTVLMAWVEATHPDCKIISVGAQYDMRVPTSQGNQYIDLVGQLTLGELKHLIAGAKCFIGGDSGPYHVACSTDTPIIALLSHLAPEQILPWRDGEFGKNVEVVQSKVPCVGCYSRQVAPVRNLVCESQEQWACAKHFDSLDINNKLDAILKKV